MNIIYAHEDFVDENNFYGNKKIFLVGPTPRSAEVKSWRPAFIDILSKFEASKNYYVFVPEDRNGKCEMDYIDQVEWEHRFLHHANIIVAWVPRELKTMPAFTTNIEFGYFIHTGKILYGRPEGAPKTKYLDWLYEHETNSKPFTNMKDLAKQVVEWRGNGNW